MLWLTIIFGALFVWYFMLHQRATTERRDLSNYALLVLLDDKIYRAQREGLVGFVRTTEAKDALELGMKANMSVIHLARQLGNTLLGTQGLLWKLRTETPSIEASLRERQ